MKVVHSFEEARAVANGTVGLVPTMGYLHEGHLSLIERAAAECETTVVTVYVNPLQFGDGGDLAAYPQDLERDAPLAERAGADVLVAPSDAYMYPTPPSVTVAPGPVGDTMEGRHRPGHFTGVATVVTKLLAGIDPDAAYFGRKDAQQLAVVRSLVADLSFRARIVACPIVRESDGLALSSRNPRLSPEARNDALVLAQALFAAADVLEGGGTDPGAVEDAARTVFARSPQVVVDYVTLADSATAEAAESVGGAQFIAAAATVGGVRLIDAVTIDEAGVDRGVTLRSPSILYGGA